MDTGFSPEDRAAFETCLLSTSGDPLGLAADGAEDVRQIAIATSTATAQAESSSQACRSSSSAELAPARDAGLQPLADFPGATLEGIDGDRAAARHPIVPTSVTRPPPIARRREKMAGSFWAARRSTSPRITRGSGTRSSSPSAASRMVRIRTGWRASRSSTPGACTSRTTPRYGNEAATRRSADRPGDHPPTICTAQAFEMAVFI